MKALTSFEMNISKGRKARRAIASVSPLAIVVETPSPQLRSLPSLYLLVVAS